MTLKQAEKNRKAIAKLGREVDRKENRKALVKLDAHLKLIRDELRANLKEQKETCSAEFASVKAEADAAYQAMHGKAVELRRQRKERKRAQCRNDARDIRERGKAKLAEVRSTGKAKLAERRHEQGADARVAAAQKARRPKVSAIERLQESDDRVRNDIDPDLVVVFNKVRGTIRGTDTMSRSEAFAHFVHENPEVVQEIQIEAADRKVEAMTRQLERDLYGDEYKPPKPPRKRRAKPKDAQQKLAERWAGELGAAGPQQNLRPRGRKKRPGRVLPADDAFEPVPF